MRPRTLGEWVRAIGRAAIANLGLKLVALAIAIAVYVLVRRASEAPSAEPNGPPPVCSCTCAPPPCTCRCAPARALP